MRWWQVLNIELERMSSRGSANWSDLLRDGRWGEEVAEAEAVDQPGEDRVVRPPLAPHSCLLTAPVPVGGNQFHLRF